VKYQWVEEVDIPTRNKYGRHQVGGGQGQRTGRATLLSYLVEFWPLRMEYLAWVLRESGDTSSLIAQFLP